MKIIILLLFIFPLGANALELKVMTFNTMCDFCKGSDFFKFDDRLKHLRTVIENHSPDLIALQEVRTASQVKELLTNLPEYKFSVTENMFFSYADPALIYNSKKIKLIKSHQRWLGPSNDGFSLGWKFALPRQILWAQMQAKEQKFIFSSTHFDNRIENLAGAAKLVNSIFINEKLPIIFAADTNLTVDMPEYQQLIKNIFRNAFDLKKSITITGKYTADTDVCYLRKGDNFPACRVDHILLSQSHLWTVENFIIDTSKFGNRFPSDHRPVITNLKLKE